MNTIEIGGWEVVCEPDREIGREVRLEDAISCGAGEMGKGRKDVRDGDGMKGVRERLEFKLNLKLRVDHFL